MSKLSRKRKLSTESLESRQLLHGGGFGLMGPITVDEQVEAVFERYDETGDGILDADDELSTRVEERLADADADGDGGVTADELVEYLETSRVSNLLGVGDTSDRGCYRGDAADRVEAAIELVDEDGEGDIDQGEVSAELWETLAAADTDANASLSAEELTTLVETLDAEKEATALASRVESIFSSLDDDGDSLIAETEVSATMWERIAAADTDDDQAVSEDEMSEFLQQQDAEREATRQIEGGGRGQHHGSRRGGRGGGRGR